MKLPKKNFGKQPKRWIPMGIIRYDGEFASITESITDATTDVLFGLNENAAKSDTLTTGTSIWIRKNSIG